MIVPIVPEARTAITDADVLAEDRKLTASVTRIASPVANFAGAAVVVVVVEAFTQASSIDQPLWPPEVRMFHQVNPFAVCGPPRTVAVAPGLENVTTEFDVPAPLRTLTASVQTIASPTEKVPPLGAAVVVVVGPDVVVVVVVGPEVVVVVVVPEEVFVSQS